MVGRYAPDERKEAKKFSVAEMESEAMNVSFRLSTALRSLQVKIIFVRKEP